MNTNNSHIYTLIANYSNGDITKAEYAELKQWLEKDTANKKTFTDILVTIKNAKQVNYLLSKDNSQAWDIIQSKLHKRKTLRRRKWLQYAAAILIPIAVTLTYTLTHNAKVPTLQEQIITPGGTQAILILADGSQIDLQAANDSIILSNGKVIINKESSRLNYSKTKVQQEEFNTLHIPRGGEYQLVLSDGTKVWLNSDTRLTYPVQFMSKTREITLAGEAYLEVAHNQNKPFIVHTTQGSIEVLGTSFNIKAYSDENTIKTTLVEGSVRLRSTNHAEVILSPSEQGILSDAASIEVSTVDIRLHTAWKNGMFAFKGQTLENIMNTFERWYDVDIIFENESLKNRHFTGNLQRYKEINTHLDLIKLCTDINFEVQGKQIIVK